MFYGFCACAITVINWVIRQTANRHEAFFRLGFPAGTQKLSLKWPDGFLAHLHRILVKWNPILHGHGLFGVSTENFGFWIHVYHSFHRKRRCNRGYHMADNVWNFFVVLSYSHSFLGRQNSLVETRSAVGFTAFPFSLEERSHSGAGNPFFIHDGKSTQFDFELVF